MNKYSALIGILALSGCAQFTKDPASGISSLETQGVITTWGTLKDPAQKVPAAISDDKDLAPLFSEGGDCGPAKPSPPKPVTKDGVEMAGVALVPFIVAASAYIVERAAKSYDKKLGDLKKASEQLDEVQLSVSPEILSNAKCITYLRFSSDPKSKKDEEAQPRLGLAVVFKINGRSGQSTLAALFNKEKVPDYFTFQPIFVRARDSIAVTGHELPIRISAGVAVQQIGTVNGVPTLLPVGNSSTTVKNVVLGSEIECDDGKCKSSSIIPYPAPMGTVVVGISITESGDVGFDIDDRQAEAKAIGAALGPTVEQAVQGHYTRESERNASK